MGVEFGNIDGTFRVGPVEINVRKPGQGAPDPQQEYQRTYQENIYLRNQVEQLQAKVAELEAEVKKLKGKKRGEQ